MSERFYWVNPADTADIQGWWRVGQRVVLADGTVVTGNLAGADWTIGMYLAIQDDTQVDGRYYTRSVDLAFEGAVDSNASRVRETVVQTLRSLDEVYDAKVSELNVYTESVLTSNCASSLNANWVISLDNIQSEWITRVNWFLQDRMRDRVYDDDPKDYWPRDVPLVAFNKNNHKRVRAVVNESEWGATIKDIGLHTFAAVDAQEACLADIDTAYGSSDAQAIVDIDVTDPLYGWPPVYEPPDTGQARGNGR